MALNEKLVHLRYCRLVCRDQSFSVSFSGQEYLLSFQDARFATQKGYLITRVDGEPVESDFLLWLSVYLGEDAIAPHQEVDTRFVWYRGDLHLDQVQLQTFLVAAARARKRRWPRWKRDLFDMAIIYFSAAVRAGVNMMPITLGLFALSLECLGNVKYGKRDRHHTFGDKQFMRLLSNRLAPLKRDPAKRDAAKALQKRLAADIDLLNHLRNAFYGHSLLHLRQDRVRLVSLLKKWYLRNGHKGPFTNLSFRSTRVFDDVGRESDALYKLGLRLNRLFLFLAVGFLKSVPFATHDWHVLGDLRQGETTQYRGARVTATFGTAPNATPP